MRHSQLDPVKAVQKPAPKKRGRCKGGTKRFNMALAYMLLKELRRTRQLNKMLKKTERLLAEVESTLDKLESGVMQVTRNAGSDDGQDGRRSQATTGGPSSRLKE
eukprot:TRINITY_DN38358_c0_g1_i1.p1 TRINITY_DN38358_c0_g1~~TRINITY_DN38358_c0_g1_i1.p1  ORF type:complete len:105 (+),score=3.41 TRINITY_DN38358_c0_g1_i1:48-362(+)